MNHLRLLIATLCLGALAGCNTSDHTDPGGNTNPSQPLTMDTVSGTVLFKGSPLAGATVTAFLTNSSTVFQTATTDASGNYTFTNMNPWGNSPANFDIWVQRSGYGFYPTLAAATTGALVTRADHTGDYLGNGLTDVPIYLTVINDTAQKNLSLSGADFNAFDGTNPPAKVAATGQQTSLLSGDDASLHKGVAWPSPRFIDNEDGTITDRLTGLLWLKNAACFAPTTWAAALADANALASGACGLSDRSTAGQWRLPNLNELESIIDVSAANPAVSAGSPFTNVASAIYWTSTSYFGGENGSPYAWVIRLSDGRFINDNTDNDKTHAANNLWAVRGSGAGSPAQLQSTGMYDTFAAGDDGSLQAGLPLNYPRFVDNNNGTVTDTETGLIWLKQANCIDQPWSVAIATVNSLANGQCGLADGSSAGQWRMPNRNEMQSLADRMQTNESDFFNHTFLNLDSTVYQSPIFTNFVVSQYYWTSTTDAAVPTSAWTVFSCDFGVYDTPKAQSGYTLAVR
jgi:hypothetical protein